MKIPLEAFPEKYATGSKVMVWGRFIRLIFKPTESNQFRASGGSPITIELPKGLFWQEHQISIAETVKFLLHRRLKETIHKFMDYTPLK